MKIFILILMLTLSACGKFPTPAEQAAWEQAVLVAASPSPTPMEQPEPVETPSHAICGGTFQPRCPQPPTGMPPYMIPPQMFPSVPSPSPSVPQQE